MRRLATCLTALAAICTLVPPRACRATPTENDGIRVLPAPGVVTIDGQDNDWDLSGGIFACDYVETQRDKMGVWLHAMYDKDNLYLLAHFLDETPLNNPGQTIADYGFAGDCLQFRVLTAPGTPQERTSHWTCWRGRDKVDIMDVAYGKRFNEGGIKDAKTKGAQQAFTIDADGKGYIQEMAIPWQLIDKDGAPAPTNGSVFRLTFEPNFTVGKNGRMSLKDNFQANIRPDRVFTFYAWQHWGNATLVANGHVAPQAERLADGREFNVAMENGHPVIDWTGLIVNHEQPGFVNVAFTMPQDGYISLNIKAPDGTVARHLLNGAFYTKGRHEVKWDGLTTPNAKLPGQPVPAGHYTWSALWNTGIGLKLRGWAANGGKSPWDNGPGGNWGGDEGNPSSTAADGKQVYLGWSFAEAGQALLACDLDGNVKWHNKRGGMAGVKAIAAADGIVYVLGGGAGNAAEGGAIYKLDAADGSYLPWGNTTDADIVVKSLFDDGANAPDKAEHIAASNGKIYLSFAAAGKVLILDGKTGQVLKTRMVPAPGALQAGADDGVTVLSNGTSVVRLDSHGSAKTIVDNLTNAVALALDKDGNIYVGAGDPDNQVKVFDTDGKALRTIGHSGGRALLGAWQPDGMRFINSISIGADGKLWLAEADQYPRRMSAWNTATGQVWKEFFGSTTYGALGGAIDPLDPNVMVGLGCEWRLDPATGHAACVSVITRDGMENSRFGIGANGRLYLAVAPAWRNAPFVSIFERTGEGQYKLRSKFLYDGGDAKKPPTGTRFWADLNGDGAEQPEEISAPTAYYPFAGWYMAFTPDMTIYSGDSQFKVQGFTPAGAPIYDLFHPTKMPHRGERGGMGASDGVGSADGSVMLYNGAYGTDRSTFDAYDVATGQPIWSYPNNFVGVHGSHNATGPEPGMIRGAYDIAGVAKLPAPIGNIFVIPTNVGEWHILTGDGFYLTKLFQGDSMKVQWPETAVPGAIMDSTPPGLGGEDFGGSIAYGQDGKLYVQAGKTGFWNLEVTGLDTVRAMPGGEIDIAPTDLAQAETMREAQLQEVVGKHELTLHRATPVFTGKLKADFPGAEEIAYAKTDDAAVKSIAAYDDANLYLGWDVVDNTPWENAARAPEEMYVSGDTVDFQLGADPAEPKDHAEPVAGDLRLSIGNFGGTATAVLYRKVAALKKPKVFSSGVIKNYPMDFVDVLADANIAVTKGRNGYVVEAAIPLADLGLKPADGLSLRGDFGATFGSPDGGRTRLRSYWNNQHTGIVDDAVFELMMEPRNWGQLDFGP